MTSIDLRALLDDWKVLEAAATEGPWFAEGRCLMHDERYADLDLDYRVSLLDGTDGVDPGGWCEEAADAEFIAASRTLVPRLLAAVRAVLAIEYTDGDDHWDAGYDFALEQARAAITTALIGYDHD